MSTTRTIRAYYEALRRGEPLSPFFAECSGVVKFGITERLTGYDAIADGLCEQTHTTDDWIVKSRRLQVTEREHHAWFSDDVYMAWSETSTGTRNAYETRWSGTLEDRDGWAFVGMHVSTPDSPDDPNDSGER